MASFEIWLIAGRAVFLLFSFTLAVVAFTRWRRAAQAQTDRLLANHEVMLQRLADLEARVDATNRSVAEVGERIGRPQQPPLSVSAAPAPGYQIAIRLAKSGASLDELISGCGLSIYEAELVHRLHAPQAKNGGRKQRAADPNAAPNQPRAA
jgi:alkylation response protein AidB-like acyl-CoA dehydrogenase